MKQVDTILAGPREHACGSGTGHDNEALVDWGSFG